MSSLPTVLVVLRNHSNLGEQATATGWQTFIKITKAEIKKHGKEIKGSQPDLMLFSFDSIPKAVQSTFFALQTAKSHCNWQADFGNVPIQIVLHSPKIGTSLPLRDSAHEFWTKIPLEKLYITDGLKKVWSDLQENETLPPVSDSAAYSGCFQLLIKSKSQNSKQLYTGRGIFIQGDHPQCFYCGMRNHTPANCPSKKITLANRSLEDMAYLPFAELNGLVPKVYKNYLKLMKLLIEGVNPTTIKKNKELLVLTGYLDIYLLYQFRYLWQVSFDEYFEWQGRSVGKGDLIFDNNNLQLGLDSLRVGEYKTATQLLTQESRLIKSTVSCFAHIGLAFIVLENDRFNEMERHLERGKEVAKTEQQRIYVHLLLCRYHELSGVEWKLKETMSEMLALNFDSIDLKYRKLQASVILNKNREKIKKQIKEIISGNKEWFIIALMDPALTPYQGQLDPLAKHEFQTLRKNAAQKMLQAKDDFFRLQPWFAKKDKFIQDQFKALKQMGEQLQHQSYFDLLDVEERCSGLISTCKRELEEKKKYLEQEIARVTTTIETCQATWQVFNFKNLFKTFQTDLLNLEEQLKKTEHLFKQDSAESYQQATTTFLEVVKASDKLMKRQATMLKIASWLKGGKLFAKRLAIIDGILFTLTGTLFICSDTLKSSDLTLIVELGRNPAMIKALTIISLLVIGPSIGLIWTLKTTMDSVEYQE